tara:strand:- start:37010 stop:38047 length:1038 start_codon:yes stop_codon:yes gene_type:complete
MYFSKFPLIAYRNLAQNDKDETVKVARDIVRRVAFSKRLKDEAALFQDYYVKEGEKPEDVAYKVYGDPHYHWVVLLFNDVINPYYEWPLTNEAIDNYIAKKYPGDVLYCSSLFVDASGYTSAGDNYSGLTHAANETVFRWDGRKDDYGDVLIDHTSKALVWKHDREKGALEIINTHGAFNVGDYVVKTVGGDNFQYSRIEKIIENVHGLHHFELEGVTAGEEEWLDALCSNDGIPLGQTGAGPTNGTKTVGGTGSGANVASAVAFTDTRIAKYMGAGPANSGTLSNSIANDVYEYRTNDRRREIKLLDPTYLEIVLTELETVATKGNDRTIFNAPREQRKQSNNY